MSIRHGEWVTVPDSAADDAIVTGYFGFRGQREWWETTARLGMIRLPPPRQLPDFPGVPANVIHASTAQ